MCNFRHLTMNAGHYRALALRCMSREREPAQLLPLIFPHKLETLKKDIDCMLATHEGNHKANTIVI